MSRSNNFSIVLPLVLKSPKTTQHARLGKKFCVSIIDFCDFQHVAAHLSKKTFYHKSVMKCFLLLVLFSSGGIVIIGLHLYNEAFGDICQRDCRTPQVSHVT